MSLRIASIALDAAGLLQGKGVRSALATALFRDGHLSLVRAARLTEMPVTTFAAHLSRLGVPIVRLSEEEIEQDMDTLEECLTSFDAVCASPNFRSANGWLPA